MEVSHRKVSPHLGSEFRRLEHALCFLKTRGSISITVYPPLLPALLGAILKQCANYQMWNQLKGYKISTPYQTNGLNRRNLAIFASPIFKTGIKAFIQYILFSCEIRILIGHPPKNRRMLTCYRSQFKCTS